MAKKITRGITGIKDITKQDFDTNNVNDLLSDGQYNYIHRKKGKSKEYHNLTDNIKTISSDNTELLSVTNNNKTNNTATLHPKHDAQKEQVLESERNTVSIRHATNGTPEKTKVDTNPEKVLEHTNLLTDYGISKTSSGNTTKIGVEYTKVEDGFDLNNLRNGFVKGSNLTNAPSPSEWYFVETFSEGAWSVQKATPLVNRNTQYLRAKERDTWGAWREQVGDRSVIDSLLAQKQNALTSNNSIGVLDNNTLCQLFYHNKTYNQPGGILKTHVKALAQNTSISDTKDEYNFLLKINQGESTLTFELDSNDKYFFSYVLRPSNTANISGCNFTLSGSTLTVSTNNNTDKNYIVTYSELFFDKQ